MKACLDLLWNVLANADPGDADWANHLPVDTNNYRNGDHILWPAWELYDTIWWDLAGGQMAETSSDAEGYNKDWDLECLYNVQDK